ncbi:hypothetical protein BC831DRAFT_299770 [Entophlyctis helioformis]|nr:hypothetical protein BC831DRAFT_299770 [Entophlyctis helioformis]
MRAQQQRAMPDPDAAALAAQLHTSNNEPNDNDAGDSTTTSTTPSTRPSRQRATLSPICTDMVQLSLVESFGGTTRRTVPDAMQQAVERAVPEKRGRGRLRGMPNKPGGQKAGCRQASRCVDSLSVQACSIAHRRRRHSSLTAVSVWSWH